MSTNARMRDSDGQWSMVNGQWSYGQWSMVIWEPMDRSSQPPALRMSSIIYPHFLNSQQDNKSTVAKGYCPFRGQIVQLFNTDPIIPKLFLFATFV